LIASTNFEMGIASPAAEAESTTASIPTTGVLIVSRLTLIHRFHRTVDSFRAGYEQSASEEFQATLEAKKPARIPLAHTACVLRPEVN
jgi:hypothetical protein